MSKSNRALLLGALLAATPVAAQAQRLTAMPASRFFQTCQSRGGQTVCDAYISGLSDGVTLTESGVPKEADGKPAVAPTICVPPTNGAVLRGQVVGWLSGHTDMLKGDVGPAVHAALLGLFPCVKGAGKP